jgi:glutamate-1-semialdehyde 2,1-aminomutase
MDHVLPAGRVFQAGTLSGNPLATAAGIATLQLLRDHPPYVQLEALGARLERGLHCAASDAGIPHQIARVGSMMTFFFNPTVVIDWETASRSDTAGYSKYFWGLLDRGVYMPCSQYEALFISAAHREADIDATVGAAAEAFSDLRS